MKQTPQSSKPLNVSKMATQLRQKMDRRGPTNADPKPATKNFDKMNDDKGTADAKDKMTTLVHLLDSVDFNMNHGYNHVMEAKLHSEKVIAHLQKNPELNTAYASLYQRLTKVNDKLKRFQPKD